MRIVLTNPGGIGDVVLLQPMLAALCEAGHEVLFACRAHGAALVGRMDRRARGLVVLNENPYEYTKEAGPVFDAGVLEEVRRFGAEVLVFGAYKWTVLEEKLAGMLSGVKRIRMNGVGFRNSPYQGFPLAACVEEEVVAVEEGWHEGRKNEALCGAVLGFGVRLGDPVLTVEEGDRRLARKWLAETGEGWMECAEAGRLWVGCMGQAGGMYADLKAWREEKWAAVLRYLVGEKGRRVVLMGSAAEGESLVNLRERSGVGEGLQIVTGAANGEALARMIGLMAMSAGYVGRDTGPMHVAGTLGKAVVGVFGAGMWARFTPLVTPSYAMTTGVACASCQWECPYSESYCVKDVGVEAVRGALEAILEGKAEGVREVRMVASSREAVAAMERERGTMTR